jgi:hypothetical protein
VFSFIWELVYLKDTISPYSIAGSTLITGNKHKKELQMLFLAWTLVIAYKYWRASRKSVNK